MRSIGSEVGSSGSLRTSLQYMPRSRALIERMVDTDYSFMLRRLQFAAALFVEDRTCPKPPQLAQREGFAFRVVRGKEEQVESAVNVTRSKQRKATDRGR